ncbi:programmed cell death protein 2-like [Centruroides sculpturatus]|uniref:programmed cell death protein 2-like n=1 Tax=Centruroides sculpturatus TaxID=218467 RepID=UPI000C6D8D54|nr:programmed cell death protein 2-like [Centruroides sculpturatus]
MASNESTCASKTESLQEVELGFAEKTESWRLRSKYFPSKVGGKPSWLNLRDLPLEKHLECKLCQKPLVFLLQIYAPFEENPNTFHRSIFIFVCKDPRCCKSNENKNFVVFRCQLPRDNQYYSPQPPIEEECDSHKPSAEDFRKLCCVCGCVGTKQCSRCHSGVYCSRHHQKIDWIKRHKFLCVENNDPKAKIAIPESLIPTEKHNFLFGEYSIEMEIEEFNNELEAEKSEEEKMNEYKKFLKESKARIFMRGEDPNENDLEEMALKSDKIFSKFMKIIKHNPDQIVRYQRGGMPLWISSSNTPTQIPKCPCGSERQFEFQIMPQLLNYLDVDNVKESIDWGILAVYTCIRSCEFGVAYKPEYLWKQDFDHIIHTNEEKSEVNDN